MGGAARLGQAFQRDPAWLSPASQIQKGLCRFLRTGLLHFSRSLARPAYFFAGAAGAVGAVAAGAGVTAALAAAPALASASVVAFLASAAFLAMPATRRQYALSTLPVLASAFVGTIQPQAVASALHAVSSLPLQITGVTLATAAAAADFGATGVAGALAAAAGAAGAAAFGATTAGAAGAVGAVVCALAAAAKSTNAPAAAVTPLVHVEVFITAVISSG
jgi:hypothetical protein